MIRAIIQYETEPDAERYARHLEESCLRWSAARSVTVAFRLTVRRAERPLLRRVRVGRHGCLQGGGGSEAFAASGRDAMAMGIPFTVHFVSID